MIKQKYTRDEVIEILRRNLTALKDDAVFSDYIINVAMFLVEHQMYKRSQTPPLTGQNGVSESEQMRRAWLKNNHDRDFDLYKVFQKYAPARGNESACRMCGSPTKGAITCPACGNLSI